MKSSGNRVIRVIAVFKLLKATVLIAVGAGVLKLLHQDVASVLERWILMLGLDPGSRFVDLALQKAMDLTPNKLKVLGIGTLIYAGLFLTEGIGLWMMKRWAEWLTVTITSSLVPVEIYEIHKHSGPVKIGVLVVNIAVVMYLIYHIRKERAGVSST